MFRLFVYLLLGASLVSSVRAEALDAAAGAELHKENCTRCHGSEMYTRPNRKMHSFQSIRTQVGRCEQSLGLQWFEDDIGNVAAYLNNTHYKFPSP